MSKLRIVPLGGLGEIGMNCMILEHEEEIILIDCGILFSDLDHFGVEFVIPDFTYLRERKDKIKAIVVTHGHEDHIGAIPFAIKAGLHCPIYASAFSTLLIRARLEEHGLADQTEIRVFKMGERFDFKHFKITPISVNHSIVDAAALFIDTPIGKIVHTGDFKIDATPFFGEQIDLNLFGRAGEEGVQLLLSDSTNVERHTHSLSESIIYKKFEQLFGDAEGLTVIAMFASNVGRMGQVFDLARKMKKRVAIAGRGMEQNMRHAITAGYLKGIEPLLISLEDLDDYKREDVVVLSTGSQAEHTSALTRVSLGEHKHLHLQPKDLVVLSSRYIPGNEKDIGRMVNNLFKQGAEVLYETVNDIHVSGHATRPELKRMVELTRPRFFIPIHGEYRHLVHHTAVAKEAGVKPENVLLAVNGDVIEITKDTCEIVDHMEEPRVLIEGREGNDVSKLVLKDRRHLGEKGVVFSLMVRNAETRKIIAGPEIITRGLTGEKMEAWLIEEGRKLVRRVVARHDKELAGGGPEHDLQETIRIELRRFFNQHIGKKPIVLPIILDL